jgi:hypothetical protein
MSHFRKMLFAAAVVASFIGTSGTASAQTNPFVCNTSFSPLVVRVEGLRELVGDIVITCQGGNAVTGVIRSNVPELSANVPTITIAQNGFPSGTQGIGTVGNGALSGCWLAYAPVTIPAGQTCAQAGGVLGGTATFTPMLSVPAINISVTIAGTRITNRIFGSTNLTDALLFIDEPALPNSASSVLNQNPCANLSTTVGTAGVCTQQSYFFGSGASAGLAIGSGYPTGSSGVPGLPSGSTLSTTSTNTPLNVYQAQYGVGGGFAPNEQTITFVGVPVVQPGPTGGTRVYRIKNIRVQVANAFQVNGQIQAFISIQNPPANLVLNNAQGVVGFVQRGLFFDTVQGSPYAQCLGFNARSSGSAYPTEGASTQDNLVSTGALRFTEAYGVAFKRRGIGGPLDTFDANFNQYYLNGFGQADPRVNYNNESGFYNTTYPTATSLNDAGIASNGTRLRARFSGVPSQVRVYVSVQPITAAANCSGSTAAGRIGRDSANSAGFCIGQGADARNAAYAVAGANADGAVTGFTGVTSASQVFGVNAGTSGTALVQGSTTTAGWGLAAAYTGLNLTPQLARVAIAADGTGTFFWEVLRADDNVIDRFDFLVAIAFPVTTSIVTDANTSVVANVSGNYAPIAATGGNSYPSVPSFVLTQPEELRPIFTIVNCATNLLYPFVSSVTGFNTGIAVANTSKDPFGTVNETGICRVFFYGTTAGGGIDPTPQSFSKAVPSGQVATFNLLFGGSEYGIQPVVGFQGYVIISCNFRWAHGFAFVSDPSNLQTAHGYLALIMDEFGTLRRRTGNNSESLDN